MKAYIKPYDRWMRLDDVVYHILRNRRDMADRMLQEEIGSLELDVDDVTFYLNPDDFKALELTNSMHIIEAYGNVELETIPKYK